MIADDGDGRLEHYGTRSRTSGPPKTQQAVPAALEHGRAANANPEVTPDHLLAALLRQDDSIVLPVLQKLGLAPLMVRNRADEAVAKLPKAYGAAEPALSRETTAVFDAAEAARKELRDDYLSVEHLLLAMADRLGVGRRGAAGRAARGPRQPPRHQPEPRGAVPGPRALRPRPHPGGPRRASSTRSSAATTRSAGSSRCCRGAPRTTRCSSASPASARPPSSRVSPGASPTATCPRA